MVNPALLQDMMLFVEVARKGNFSRASAALGMPGATLSRRIAAMERDFGVRLFDRTTRRVELTEAGRRYLERCGHLVDEARLAQEALRDETTRPAGHLRVSMPVDLGVSVIGPLIPDFVRQYPSITLDIDLSSRSVDLIADHIDLAIRLGNVQDDKLIAKRLGSIEMALFASPVYLELHGLPKHPSDLVHHACVLIRGTSATTTWQLEGKKGKPCKVLVDGKLKLNNQGLMRLMAERGMGITPLAMSLAAEAMAQGRLIQILPDWRMPSMPIHALTTSRLQSASTRALVDFLSARLEVQAAPFFTQTKHPID
jgi:DNA-binding transcriptional LysR family regulator